MTAYLLRLLRVTLHTPIFLIVSLRSSHFLMSFVNVWLYNGSWIRVCLMPEECVLWFLWHSSTQTWEEHILVHFHFNLLSFSNLSVTHIFDCRRFTPSWYLWLLIINCMQIDFLLFSHTSSFLFFKEEKVTLCEKWSVPAQIELVSWWKKAFAN